MNSSFVDQEKKVKATNNEAIIEEMTEANHPKKLQDISKKE